MPGEDETDRDASARDALQDASDAVRRQARAAVDEAQRTAASYAEEGKKTAASHLNVFARAVRSASHELAKHDKGIAARVVTEAADGLERAASSVSGASVDELMGSARTFARRNPGAFMIGAVLAGVALGHLAKSAGRPGQDEPARLPPPTEASDTGENESTHTPPPPNETAS